MSDCTGPACKPLVDPNAPLPVAFGPGRVAPQMIGEARKLEDGTTAATFKFDRSLRMPTVVSPKAPRTVRNMRDKVHKNGTCPCGSGRKYKRCCAFVGTVVE